MTDKITKIGKTERVERNDREYIDPNAPEVGKWFWVRYEDDDGKSGKWLGCVTHVGSNYAEMEGPSNSEHGGTYDRRVHLDEFNDVCEHEPEALTIIEKSIQQRQVRVALLMGEVREITARLGVGVTKRLESGSEAQALAVRGSSEPIEKYKKDLAKAKDKQLPKLFEEIQKESKIMAHWMVASLIPMKAQAQALRPVIKAVEARIFNVELYAGLVEQLEKVQDGTPAGMHEKIHLFQRRHYMDEECLANYEAGGMEFKNIHEFDAWLCRPENLSRIMPFQRCIVAFQVRRNAKEREAANLRQFIEMGNLIEADKKTFLYMRNGEQIFRLRTGIEFDEKLFPDLDRYALSSGQKLYAKMYGDSVSELITEGALLEMKAANERFEAEKAAWTEEEQRKNWHRSAPYSLSQYQPFTHESVYFDDISKYVKEEMDKHNRLVLVLQGLLDRSPAMVPNPGWRVWDPAGFEAALVLVYDQSRALTTGEKPDFEAYRERLNESLKEGSVTVGQEDRWLEHEAEKENKRIANNWRAARNHNRDYVKYRPYDNPGPGLLGRVVRIAPKKGEVYYAWERKRLKKKSWPYNTSENVKDGIRAKVTEVLNVDAYKPGDFKQFFADPRTRAEYLKWAPLLLVAEDFLAGKREVGEPGSSHSQFE